MVHICTIFALAVWKGLIHKVGNAHHQNENKKLSLCRCIYKVLSQLPYLVRLYVLESNTCPGTLQVSNVVDNVDPSYAWREVLATSFLFHTPPAGYTQLPRAMHAGRGQNFLSWRSRSSSSWNRRRKSCWYVLMSLSKYVSVHSMYS